MKAPGKLLLIILVMVAQAASARSHPQSSDEASLATLITNYFTAYAQLDLEALVKLWSFRSPDLASGIEEAQRTQAGRSSSVTNVVVSRVRVADNKAVLQASADFTLSDAQPQAKRQERRIRNFALIKEAGAWKVWRDAPASEDLSAFLDKGSEWKVSADSIEQFAVTLVNSNEADRDSLLAENPKMVTKELADALTRKAGPLQMPGSYDRAINLLRLAGKIAGHLNDTGRIANVERALGDVYREWGRSPDALKHYHEAVAAFEATGRGGSKAVTLLSIGQVYFAQKNYKLAIETYEKALAEFDSLKNNRAIADTLEELASVYYEQESYDRALELFVKCLKLRETYASKAEIASTLNSIGNANFQRHEYEAAIQQYEKALAAFEGLNDADAVVSTLSNIASAHYSEGNYEAALDRYLRALTLQDGLRDRQIGASLRMSIANIYSAQGNYSLALEHLRKGLGMFESLRNRSKIANALSELGEAYVQLQNYPEALAHHQKSLSLYEELGSLADSSMRLYAIGNVRFVMGDYDLAIENYEKAQTQFEKIKHAPGVASMLASIAGVRYAQQKYDLAIEFYQKGLAAYEALGDRPRAAGLIERIAAVRYSKGEYSESLELAARAGELAEKLSIPDTLWRARLTQGFAYRASGDAERSKQSFEQSIATIESMRETLVHGEPDAQRFFQSRNAAYVAMLELLVAQNKAPEAFAYAERIRANSLIDMLQRVQITKSMTSIEAEQERKLERAVIAVKAQMNHQRERTRPDLQRYATLQLRLQRSVEDYRAFENALYAAHPMLRALRGEGGSFKPESAASLLRDPGVALLQFVVADTRTYLFALTRDSRRAAAAHAQASPYILNAYVINAGRAEIADRVRRFREMIAQHDDKIQQGAREIHDLLFGPAREQVSDKPTWVIMPDDALWQLPFAALQPGDHRFLIEDHALALAPSLTTFAEIMRPRAQKAGRVTQSALLAVGNPAISKRTAEQSKLMGGPETFNLSPESENELKSLERLYAPASKVLVGTEAGESAVKQEAGQFGVIHLSAPAILSDASPMFSRILLAESGKEDGLLETWEISKLELKAGIVSLSASDLVASRAGGGEAISSLAWMLFVAGCPTDVLTLWSQNSSSRLIAEFHRQIAAPAPAISKAKALQRAALKLLRDGQYQYPVNWAGVVLVGNPH
ncbi:MAG TPA: tetratricopeptide repeat protein [Blastocatellia bacterium]|nr:tetratricopeptide repeat protein [Blastocatellia bacterium]